MKKYLYIILLTLFILIPVNISAEGYISVSPSSLTIEQGSSKTFTITAYNTIGDVIISSNNTVVASANTSEWGTGMVDEKQTKSGTITVTGNSVGTTTITLVIDAATFDSEDLAGQTRTVSINVVAKATPEISQPTPDSTPIQKPTPEISQPTPNYPFSNLSDNNSIKELSIDGFELIKVDDTKYTLSVANHINKLNIKATLEDNKSKVEGIGEKELSVGQNDFVITVTAENGSVKQYHILITRRDDKYYLKDIDDFISSDSDTLLLLENDVVTDEILNKLKNLNKYINLTKLNSNNEIIYQIKIDPKKLNKSFSTDILFESKNNIEEKTNYAQGLNIVVNNGIPVGTKLNVYLNNKFIKGDIVNIYKYSNSNLILVDTITIEGDYILFELSDSEEYFITKANLEVQKKNNKINLSNIISFLLLVVIIVLIILLIKKKKNSKKTYNNLNTTVENEEIIESNKSENQNIEFQFNNNISANNSDDGVFNLVDEKIEFQSENNNQDNNFQSMQENNAVFEDLKQIKDNVDDIVKRYF